MITIKDLETTKKKICVFVDNEDEGHELMRLCSKYDMRWNLGEMPEEFKFPTQTKYFCFLDGIITMGTDISYPESQGYIRIQYKYLIKSDSDIIAFESILDTFDE